MAKHLTTVNHQGMVMFTLPTRPENNGGLSPQNVSIWSRGGKMKARELLARAPMRVISPLRSGIPNASPAAER